MKKLLAAVALSVLALAPATSAWAGGSDGLSSRQPAAVTAAGPDDPSSAKELYLWGCYEGHVFLVYVENGHFSGGLHNIFCDHDNHVWFA